MSRVTNRRALMVAAQHLVKTNAPDLADYEAVAQALAQIMTDDSGVTIKVVLRASAADVAKVSEAA